MITSSRWFEGRAALLLLFASGAALRALDLPRPIDRPVWRECDLAGIARNYHREGMDLFHPRVDWRGDGPGYAEMEFPAYPWALAALYRVFGCHEFLGRLLSFAASLGAMAAFFFLARELLPPRGAFFACLFFTLSPLAVELSTAIQPEPWMLLGSVLAVLFFLRWLRAESWGDYLAAVASTSAAILAKAPALYLGIVFTALLIEQRGFAWLRDCRLWLFAGLALAPPVSWYAHARTLWHTYGNSLGVSNEHHWVGPDLLYDPSILLGLLRQESRHVWTPFGIVLACVALWRGRSSPAVRLALFWLLAALVFYLAAARTTSSDWAFYYHISSVPAAALLVGAAAEYGRGLGTSARVGPTLVVLGIAFGAAAGAAASTLSLSQLGDRGLEFVSALAGCFGVVLALWLARPFLGNSLSGLIPTRPASALLVALFLAAFAGTYLWEVRGLVKLVRSRQAPDPLYETARRLRSSLEEPGLILASGGPCRGAKGYPVAYNASEMFYWLDRKGFSIPLERQSLEEVRGFEARGARYYVAYRGSMEAVPGFEHELRAHYPVVAEEGGVVVFRLTPATGDLPATVYRPGGRE